MNNEELKKKICDIIAPYVSEICRYTSWTHEYDHNDEVREFIKKWNTRVEVE